MNLTIHPQNILIDYTNWRGERSTREVIPHRIYFGSNQWHPKPQLLMEATDVQKLAIRDFAISGIHGMESVDQDAGPKPAGVAVIDNETA